MKWEDLELRVRVLEEKFNGLDEKVYRIGMFFNYHRLTSLCEKHNLEVMCYWTDAKDGRNPIYGLYSGYTEVFLGTYTQCVNFIKWTDYE